METDAPRPRAPVSRRPRAQRRVDGFQVGTVLGRAFGVLGSQFFVLVPLAAVFLALPTWLEVLQREAQLRYLASVDDGEVGDPSVLAAYGGNAGIAATIAAWLLPLAFHAVVAYVVFQRLAGAPTRYGASMREAIMRLPAVVGTSLLLGLVVLGPLGLVVVLMASSEVGAGGAGFFLLLMLGALAWAVVMFTRMYVAVQATVVERCGPAAALGRAGHLSEGARGRVFGIVLLVSVVPAVITKFVEAVFSIRSAVLEQSAGTTDIYVQAGLMTVFLSLQAVTAACVYHGLREAKEGVGVDELLKVFA